MLLYRLTRCPGICDRALAPCHKFRKASEAHLPLLRLWRLVLPRQIQHAHVGPGHSLDKLLVIAKVIANDVFQALAQATAEVKQARTDYKSEFKEWI